MTKPGKLENDQLPNAIPGTTEAVTTPLTPGEDDGERKPLAVYEANLSDLAEPEKIVVNYLPPENAANCTARRITVYQGENAVWEKDVLAVNSSGVYVYPLSNKTDQIVFWECKESGTAYSMHYEVIGFEVNGEVIRHYQKSLTLQKDQIDEYYLSKREDLIVYENSLSQYLYGAHILAESYCGMFTENAQQQREEIKFTFVFWKLGGKIPIRVTVNGKGVSGGYTFKIGCAYTVVPLVRVLEALGADVHRGGQRTLIQIKENSYFLNLMTGEMTDEENENILQTAPGGYGYYGIIDGEPVVSVDDIKLLFQIFGVTLRWDGENIIITGSLT